VISVNLPTDLLRAFVTVVDLGSYTRAGEVLGRTQPAVSLQIRRLEELVDAKLIDTVGKRPSLTNQGEMLSVYARQILSLNDEAVAQFSKRADLSRLRVGLPTDYAVTFLQNLLTRFCEQHPDVELDITCDLSHALLDSLREDELDIVVAMTSESVSQYLARAWVERPIWVVAKNSGVFKMTPVRLVAHPEGCEYRNRMIEALNAEQRPWRVVYCSPGISGVQTAVSSGMGVSALTKRTLKQDMRILTESDGFPTLSTIRVGLYYKHPRQTSSGLLLINYLIAQLDQANEPDFRRLKYS